MFEFLNITKALAEENRLRILLALDGQELCVCQLIELLDLAPSTVSKHMTILRQARLVNGRKDGRWMYYRLADEGATTEVKEALVWVKKSLS
ncbi:MAG: winged helix-turn-helix transcriptional regulator, partial [Desulfobacterales bacterium]